jgi:heterodisulfide reductase subunit C
MVARLNKWPLLREGKIGKFLVRMPILGPMKMGLMMVFKPRTKSWGRTGEVLRQYVEEQKALAHRRG